MTDELSDEMRKRILIKKRVEWEYAKPYCQPRQTYTSEQALRADVREAITRFLPPVERHEMRQEVAERCEQQLFNPHR